MDVRRTVRFGVASLTCSLCAVAVKTTYDELGRDRPPVDEELLRKVLLGSAVLSGLALVTAAL